MAKLTESEKIAISRAQKVIEAERRELASLTDEQRKAWRSWILDLARQISRERHLDGSIDERLARIEAESLEEPQHWLPTKKRKS